MLTLATFIQYSIGSPSQSKQAREEVKITQIRKEEEKLSLLANDKALYIENPKHFTKANVGNNELSKVVRHKINNSRISCALHTNNHLSGREIEKKVPFIVASKRIKYLGRN